MNTRVLFLASSLALAAAAGCYTGSAVDTNSPYPNVVQEPTEPESGEEEEEHAPVVAEAKGLPCEVAVLIKTACGSCHGPKPSGGADKSISTWEQLTAPSEFDPSQSVAELALSRMKSAENPMPPTGNLGKTEITILEEWIDGGMKKGSCTTAKPKTDRGTTPAHDAGKEASSPPPAESVCTSGVTADPEVFGPIMRPGHACISCHASQSGPSFAAAGTVFPSAFEPNGCNGSPGSTAGLKVLIIDANGVMRSLPVNNAGNFLSPAFLADGGAATPIAKPYKALVVRGNHIREMKGTQTETDCNGCHTERGKNGAPGRIMAP